MSPTVASHPLDNIQIARPCEARWEEMSGDARVRHCQLCKLNVYNLSAMTRPEAMELLERTEGRVCVRVYQRADGTVITADCLSHIAAAKRQGASSFAIALALAGTLLAAACGVGAGQPTDPTPVEPEIVRMGDIAEPQEAPSPSPTPPPARMGKIEHVAPDPVRPLMGAPMPTKPSPTPSPSSSQSPSPQ
ncbi:MAG: hypothetical protein U1E65_20750 [Myxococcota bacterium]